MPLNWRKHLLQTYRNYGKDEEAKKAFLWFGGNIVECVNGKKNWKRKKTTVLMGEACTVSDEAFGLLMLDNYWERWVSVFNKTPAKFVVKAAYTSSTSGHRKYFSWSPEGLTRFNELYQMVKKQRSMAATGTRADEDLRRSIRKAANLNEEMSLGGDLAMLASSAIEDAGMTYVRVYNDWDDDMGCANSENVDTGKGQDEEGDGGIIPYIGL